MVASLGRRTTTFVVVAGPAGSGKTELLHSLSAVGEQVLDLEGLARHNGSAFGNLGAQHQPSHTEFQNAVRSRLVQFAPTRPVWIEDEGEYLGSVGLPDELISAIRCGACLEVSDTTVGRIGRILREYGRFSLDQWHCAVNRIAPRLGTARTAAVRAALQDDDRSAAIPILLDYYDAGYAHRSAGLNRPVLGAIRAGDLIEARRLVAR